MDYQCETRNHQNQEVRVGQNEQEAAVFRKANFFVHNLRGQVGGVDYQFKLAAPWNGFRYLLRRDEHVLASARKSTRMHAFEEDQPLIRHHLVEFQLEVAGQAYTLTPLDRHGLTFVLEQSGNEVGRYAMRPLNAQERGEWNGDLRLPDDWSVALAGFIAWILREARGRMSG